MAAPSGNAQLSVEIIPVNFERGLTLLRQYTQEAKYAQDATWSFVDAQKGYTSASTGATAAVNAHIQANNAAGMSVGQLALRIAGYSTLLTAGIAITRDVIRETINLGKEAIITAASFEKSRMTWGILLGDMKQGLEVFQELYSFSIRTPLTFKGVEPAAQMLKAFGVEVRDLIPTMEMLGNLAMGDDQKLQLIAKSYGEMFASAHVQARNLIQMVRDGVPIYDALAESMHTTVGAIAEMTQKGQLGFSDVKKAVELLNSEGHQFHDLMDTIATSATGKWNIALDNWRAILADTGENVLPLLKRALDAVNESMDKMLSKSNFQKYIEQGIGDPQTIIDALEASKKYHAHDLYPQDAYALIDAQIQSVRDVWSSRDSAKVENQRTGILPPQKTPPTPDTLTDFQNFLQDATGIEMLGLTGQQGAQLFVDKLKGNISQFDILGVDKRADYAKAIITLRDKMIESGIWTATDSTVQYLTAQADMITKNITLPSDKIQQYTPYSDTWASKVGGGVSFMGPNEAQSVLDEISRKIATSFDFTPYQDKWTNKVGGGVPLLTPEEANNILAGINARIATEIMAELADSAGKVQPDRWMYKVGGGVSFLTPEEAQFILDRMDNEISFEYALELSRMASRAPTDRWMYKPGGGIPLLTPEEADTILSGFDAKMATELRDELSASAARAPTDRWMYKPGGGVKFLTKEQADNVLSNMDNAILWDSRIALQDSAGRVETDRWMYKPGGGIPLLTQEEADNILGTIDARMATELKDELSASAARAPTDRWINKVGGGIPYMTPEQAAAALDTIAARMATEARTELSGMASKVPTDRWIYKPGGGIPLLTPAQATKVLGTTDLKINAEAWSNAAQYPVQVYNSDFESRFGMTPDEYTAKTGLALPADPNSPFAAWEYQQWLEKHQYARGGNKNTYGYDTVEGGTLYGGIYTSLDNYKRSLSAKSEMPTYASNEEYQATRERRDNARIKALQDYWYTRYPMAYGVPSTNWQGTAVEDFLNNRAKAGTFAIPYSGYVDRYSGKTGFEQVQDPVRVQEITDKLLKEQKAVEEVSKSFEDLAKSILKSAGSAAISEFKTIGEVLAGNKDAADNLGDSMRRMMLDTLNALPQILLEAGLKLVLAENYPVGLALIAASGLVAIEAGVANYEASQETVTTATPNALGNVYPTRSLSAYENGVYNTPHYFGFAKGGVFGEAGYEAIMPLTRSVSGQLGVRASVAPVNVQVVNNVGAQVSTKETTNENGERQLQILIDKAVGSAIARGKADKSMKSRYGAQVVGAQRM